MRRLEQDPAPGAHLLRHRGDLFECRLTLAEPAEGRAWLRTNVGRSSIRRRELIRAAEEGRPILAQDWHDVPMASSDGLTYRVRLPLLEVGAFEAKAFFAPARRDPVWPEGGNIAVKVEPAEYAAACGIYTAFVRQFGPCRQANPAPADTRTLQHLEAAGYAVIPPSGTFRGLRGELDLILGQMRFRILQLLPIHPVPTTYARMGRFGSPFATLDFMDVDPALAEFDGRTTPLDQFRELVDAVHERHGRLFIDIPINHTGWSSWLQIHHPEWFARGEDRSFQSPGAWGVAWKDLAKLDYRHHALWTYVADVFLYWCRQGVDGFRCDAGYMIPFAVWQYIVAKVREQFPDTVFLLEGLGGSAETTAALLGGANLNWAYSEIFQTRDQAQMDAYLPGCIQLASTKGPLVHFAETHDNNRLAAVSAPYARFRTALAALCSQNGAFGITNGLEWLATQKIDVHEAVSLNWGSAENQIPLIARLNTLLEAHPYFWEGADVSLIHTGQYNTMALLRRRAGHPAPLLILANFNDGRPSIAVWPLERYAPASPSLRDLLSDKDVAIERHEGTASCLVGPLEVLCLSGHPDDRALLDDARQGKTPLREHTSHRHARAVALDVYARYHPDSALTDLDLDKLTAALTRDPRGFCAEAAGRPDPPVAVWAWPRDTRRTVMVPPGHFLLVAAPGHFLADLRDGDTVLARVRSLTADDGRHVALVPPQEDPAACVRRTLWLTVHPPGENHRVTAEVLYLSPREPAVRVSMNPQEVRAREAFAICANGRGALAQVRGNWSEVRSQYDALLAANLHPDYPVDRQVMLTRCRGWLVYRGYSQEINGSCLQSFSRQTDGSILWQFCVPCGMGKSVPLGIRLSLQRGHNRAWLDVQRFPAGADPEHLEDSQEIRLILRPDVEDRSCHAVTKAYTGPEAQWPAAVKPLARGFVFAPAPERVLRVTASAGAFTSQPEWTYLVPHPFEADRGLNGSTDLFSPGFLTLPLRGDDAVRVKAEILPPAGASAPPDNPPATAGGAPATPPLPAQAPPPEVSLPEALRQSMQDFVVRRDGLLTVLAGYPWFLDWGRDAMICLRGLIAAGRVDQARRILLAFAAFESRGTLPNVIRGSDASNRDTSDTPLWLCVACADLLSLEGSAAFLDAPCGGRPLRDVLLAIASAYMQGTPNGIAMDPDSGLIFSPAHFTWMDTNHPAGTPREGYPIEIQALWHAALSLLQRLDPNGPWAQTRAQVQTSILTRFTQRKLGYLSDCLHARPGQRAADATADDALRPNQLLAVTLGAVTDAARCAGILAACEELLVPGAVRSLADRPVAHPLPVAHHGHMLNDPRRPYWGTYRGDEDTRRKPAYHNGTAWAWLFPSYAEALLRTYGPTAQAKAAALLGASTVLMNQGCLGHLPEITDGDWPHVPRGCGAQAWSAAELYRVLSLLK